MTAEGSALQNISKNYMKSTFLVVREREEAEYRKVANLFGCNVSVIPSSIYEDKEYGIRETRDFLFDEFNDYEYMIMIEDDQRIDMRAEVRGHYRRMSAEEKETEFPKFVALMEKADMDCPISSVLPRLFCITKADKDKLLNHDASQLTTYYMPFFNAHAEYRYKYGPKYMEDFAFQLRLIHDGYGTIVFCDYVKQDTLNNKRTEVFGGCNSVGRKFSEVDECAKEIARKYRDVVEAYWKVKPTTWGTEPVLGLKTKWSKLAKLYKGHEI
jgi:hypothetical protein